MIVGVLKYIVIEIINFTLQQPLKRLVCQGAKLVKIFHLFIHIHLRHTSFFSPFCAVPALAFNIFVISSIFGCGEQPIIADLLIYYLKTPPESIVMFIETVAVVMDVHRSNKNKATIE